LIRHILYLIGAMGSIAALSGSVLVVSVVSTGCDIVNPVPTSPVAITATQVTTTATAIALPSTPSPTLSLARIITGGCEQAEPGVYIVGLNVDPRRSFRDKYTVGGASLRDIVEDMAQEYDLTVRYVWDTIAGGFSAAIPEAQLANVIADSRVEGVYPNCRIPLPNSRSGN